MMDYAEKPVFNLVKRGLRGTGYKVRVYEICDDLAHHIVVRYSGGKVCMIDVEGDCIMVRPFRFCDSTYCDVEPSFEVVMADPDFPAKILVHTKILRRRQMDRVYRKRRVDEARRLEGLRLAEERRLEDLRLEGVRAEKRRKFEEGEVRWQDLLANPRVFSHGEGCDG